MLQTPSAKKPGFKSALDSENRANIVEADDIIVVVVGVNQVKNKFHRVLDTRTTRHFCTNKILFHVFKEASEGVCVNV